MTFGIGLDRFCKIFPFNSILTGPFNWMSAGTFTVPSRAPPAQANPLETHSNKQNTINLIIYLQPIINETC